MPCSAINLRAAGSAVVVAAAAGAKVALLDVNLEAARAVADRIGGLAVKCDVADADSGAAAIAQARERFTKDLWSHSGGERPLLVTVADEMAQARWVADEVLARIGREDARGALAPKRLEPNPDPNLRLAPRSRRPCSPIR